MGNKDVPTIKDAFTKYAEVVAILDKEVEMVADDLFTKWIYQYRCP
jgi:hypothetical protein